MVENLVEAGGLACEMPNNVGINVGSFYFGLNLYLAGYLAVRICCR